jgi:uncharacterized oxidoreductase
MAAEELRRIGTLLLDTAGSPHAESEIVSGMLVRSSLAGHDSHGVLRLAPYVSQIKSGQLRPGAPFELVRETRAMAVIDGHQGWGPVVAHRAMEIAMDKARECSVGTVVVRGSQHIGRVGEYPAMAAGQQMIGLAAVNSHGLGEEKVAPWGGLDRRLTPNPIAFAAPTGEEWPVLVDVTTSVVPDGKVRYALHAGQQLPVGSIIDHEGNPTTDPADLIGPPPGAILPLGGPVGHKGFGLGVMMELLGGALSGSGCSGQRTPDTGQGVFFQAINIADFVPYGEFIATVQELIAWIKSSRRQAGVDEILIPGEPEYRRARQRLKEGIPVADSIWDEIVQTAAELGVDLNHQQIMLEDHN